jgi:hypothetical protein
MVSAELKFGPDRSSSVSWPTLDLDFASSREAAQLSDEPAAPVISSGEVAGQAPRSGRRPVPPGASLVSPDQAQPPPSKLWEARSVECSAKRQAEVGPFKSTTPGCLRALRGFRFHRLQGQPPVRRSGVDVLQCWPANAERPLSTSLLHLAAREADTGKLRCRSGGIIRLVDGRRNRIIGSLSCLDVSSGDLQRSPVFVQALVLPREPVDSVDPHELLVLRAPFVVVDV